MELRNDLTKNLMMGTASGAEKALIPSILGDDVQEMPRGKLLV